MPGPSIPWKTLETEAWRTQIDSVPPARYKLASPRTITGSPSFAMQSADQNCVVRVYIGAGEAPDLSLTVSGTTPVPMTNAVGGNLTAQELADLRIEVGMPQPGFTLLTTDEPNGSPSAPFTTEAERTAWATANLASLLPGRTTVWGPGAVESVWNGSLATDWQSIRGPYLGSASNPFPNAAALLAAYPSGGRYVGERIAMANPAIVPRGWSLLEWSGSVWFPPAGELIATRWANPIRSVTPGVTTQVEIYGSAGNTSPIIPDYMLPDKIVFKNEMCAGISTPTTSSAYTIGLTVGGSIAALSGYNSHIAAQGNANTVGVRGAPLGLSMLGMRNGSTMQCQALGNLQNIDTPAGFFTPGANRVLIAAICGRTDDTVRLYGYNITSMGLMP